MESRADSYKVLMDTKIMSEHQLDSIVHDTARLPGPRQSCKVGKSFRRETSEFLFLCKIKMTLAWADMFIDGC